jgi:hypothetical protein
LNIDGKLKEILKPFDCQLAEDGKMLTCSRCLADTTYTCRGVCGPCFLFGDCSRPSDFRTPRVFRAGRGS